MSDEDLLGSAVGEADPNEKESLDQLKNSTERPAQHNNTSDPGDPCYSYEYSIVLCIIMVMAIVTWIIVICKIFWNKKTNLNGLDRLLIFVGLCSLVQFGPLLSAALHSGHGYYHYSQTGCKLLWYTEYGTRHTVTFLVICLYLYVHLAVRHGFESVDRKIRDNTGWIIVVLAAVQCLFGIGPAVYVDYPALTSVFSIVYKIDYCIWTRTLKINKDEIVSMELIERSWTPYILPGLAIMCSEILLTLLSASSLVKLTSQMTEPRIKSKLETVLIITISYFACNIPYAIVIMAEYYPKLYETEIDLDVTCRAKWFFTLVHQTWFFIAPSIYFIKEMNGTNVVDVLKEAGTGIKKIVEDKRRMMNQSSTPAPSPAHLHAGHNQTHEYVNRISV